MEQRTSIGAFEEGRPGPSEYHHRPSRPSGLSGLRTPHTEERDSRVTEGRLPD